MVKLLGTLFSLCLLCLFFSSSRLDHSFASFCLLLPLTIRTRALLLHLLLFTLFLASLPSILPYPSPLPHLHVILPPYFRFFRLYPSPCLCPISSSFLSPFVPSPPSSSNPSSTIHLFPLLLRRFLRPQVLSPTSWCFSPLMSFLLLPSLSSSSPSFPSSPSPDLFPLLLSSCPLLPLLLSACPLLPLLLTSCADAC